VYPAGTASMVQLEEEGHGGAPSHDDVPMGGMFVASHQPPHPLLLYSHCSPAAVPFGVYAVVQVNYIPSRHVTLALTTTELQRPHPDPTASLLCHRPHQLGSDTHVLAVRNFSYLRKTRITHTPQQMEAVECYNRCSGPRCSLRRSRSRPHTHT